MCPSTKTVNVCFDAKTRDSWRQCLFWFNNTWPSRASMFVLVMNSWWLRPFCFKTCDRWRTCLFWSKKVQQFHFFMVWDKSWWPCLFWSWTRTDIRPCLFWYNTWQLSLTYHMFSQSENEGRRSFCPVPSSLCLWELLILCNASVLLPAAIAVSAERMMAWTHLSPSVVKLLKLN